ARRSTSAVLAAVLAVSCGRRVSSSASASERAAVRRSAWSSTLRTTTPERATDTARTTASTVSALPAATRAGIERRAATMAPAASQLDHLSDIGRLGRDLEREPHASRCARELRQRQSVAADVGQGGEGLLQGVDGAHLEVLVGEALGLLELARRHEEQLRSRPV